MRYSAFLRGFLEIDCVGFYLADRLCFVVILDAFAL